MLDRIVFNNKQFLFRIEDETTVLVYKKLEGKVFKIENDAKNILLNIINKNILHISDDLELKEIKYINFFLKENMILRITDEC